MSLGIDGEKQLIESHQDDSSAKCKNIKSINQRITKQGLDSDHGSIAQKCPLTTLSLHCLIHVMGDNIHGMGCLWQYFEGCMKYA